MDNKNKPGRPGERSHNPRPKKVHIRPASEEEKEFFDSYYGDDEKTVAGDPFSVVDFEITKIKKRYKTLNYTIDALFEQLKRSIIGQDNAMKKLLFLVYNNQYLNMLEDTTGIRVKRMTGIVIGPSGTGKTATIEKIAKLFNVPYIKYNATQLTSAGYVGNDVDSIISSLVRAANGDIESAQKGIVFIDEVDKKVSGSTHNTSGRDINGTAVQEELLKLLEPSIIYVKTTKGGELEAFDTHELTVIMGGRFKGLDEIREKRLKGKKQIGFSSFDPSSIKPAFRTSDYIPEDLIEYGFIDEFVGRIAVYAEYKKLSTEAIEDIIYAEDSILSQYLNVFDSRGVDVYIDPINFHKIAEVLSDSDTGVRDLERIILELLRPALYDTEQNYCPGICEIDYNGKYTSIFGSRLSNEIKVNIIEELLNAVIEINDDDEEES